jgi:hypothetical protein
MVRAPSYRDCLWLLMPAAVIHNLEEWATEPLYGAISPGLMRHAPFALREPPRAAMEIAWVVATLGPVLLALYALKRPKSVLAQTLACWAAALFLANVFLPHLAEFAVDRAYAPGLVSAVLINLPLTAWLFRQAVREGRLSGGRAFALIGAGFVSLSITLGLILGLSIALAKALGAA